MIATAERVSSSDASDNYVFQRSKLAYVEAIKHIVKTNGKRILEVGSGDGYGIQIIAPEVEELLTIDKFKSQAVLELDYPNVKFQQINVPPLKGIPNSYFDAVVSFQVIEHIANDKLFVKEIARVLKPDGLFIVTTPNKEMSITRNPWHVREYLLDELTKLLLRDFQTVEKLGVEGNEKIMNYYNNNVESVKKITKYDIFNMQWWLPRQLLQIPYDILNRRNRKKLLNQDDQLVKSIQMDDYALVPAHRKCFDWFYIASKPRLIEKP